MGGSRVTLDNHNVTGADFQAANPSSATATFTLNASGVAQATTAGSNSNPPAGTTGYAPEWMIQGPASDYEARATLNSGSLSSGTTGSWLGLGTTRSWTCTASIGAGGGHTETNANLTIEIRSAASLTVFVSAVMVLAAEANSG